MLLQISLYLIHFIQLISFLSLAKIIDAMDLMELTLKWSVIILNYFFIFYFALINHLQTLSFHFDFFINFITIFTQFVVFKSMEYQKKFIIKFNSY